MELDPSQERAVELVCTAGIGVVTGGPGTGKTTSLRNALDRLDALGHTYLLCSPTGKASRRMREATGREAMTVHRALEWSPPDRCFLRCAAHPIDEDVVVVDESSMLDVELAHALCEAVQGSTRLILIGDADQLPSVGPGRVFGDLIASTKCPVARLTTLHRAAAESWVCSQAPEILAGRVPDLRERRDFWHVERADRDEAAEALVQVVTVGLPALGIPSEEVQVLVPQNIGPAGTDALNRRLQAILNPNRHDGSAGWKVGGEQVLFRGDRVIQTKNVYEPAEVMNGEGGVVERVSTDGGADAELVVRFDDRSVPYDRERAQKLRLAYALSVHKSQGSEWPWVVVFVHSTHTRMLTRQLLYTAITRAKRGVVLVGDRLGIERAVANESDSKRNTGLVERLREIAPDGGLMQ
jgi:exodeoxyribonuclease V alpha subunit